MLRLVHRIMDRSWVVTIGTSYCGSEVGCSDWYTVLWFGGGLLRLVHRIVVRRWGVPIGTSYCSSEWVVTIDTPYCGSGVGCCDWCTVVWFGDGFWRLVHSIVVRRWTVPIGTPYCGSEVGCYDWYTVLWFGGGLLRLVHRIVVRRWFVVIGT